MFLAALALFFISGDVVADLPSHCLKWQVVGTWDFSISAMVEGTPLCSHTQPDNIVNVYDKHLGYYNPGFEVQKNGTFTLTSNFSGSAELCLENTCENATWTMVYDEAFSIVGSESGLRLLLPFVYVPRPGISKPNPTRPEEWRSFCDRTYPGWFSYSRTEQGCAVARNRVTQRSHPSKSSLKDDFPDFATFPQSTTFLQSRIKATLSENLLSGHRASLMKSRAFDNEALKKSVEHINSKQSFWVADESAALFAKDYTVEELLKVVGGDRSKLLPPKSLSLESILDQEEKAKEEKRRSCIRQVLPPKVDWSEEPLTKTPVVNQGECGSCYAVSSTDAFTSRIRLKFQNASIDEISPKPVVKCSYVNQGCDGGFPWLVAYDGHFSGLYSSTCMPYVQNGQTCSTLQREPVCSSNVHYITKWGYVGGYYGRGNAEDMMWSLYRDGPLVVAMNVDATLYVYRKGLYGANAHMKDEDEIKISQAYWEATTHAVTLVGYGNMTFDGESVDTWKIKNSWGETWGNDGYFFVQRGSDTLAVESMAVHAIFGDGKPGNPEFESFVRSRLAELNDDNCTQLIEDMLQTDLV